MSRGLPHRPRLIAVALLSAVFAAGVAVGYTLHRLMRPQLQMRSAITADMSGVLEKLDLTPAQRAQADSIFERRAPATEATMHEVAGRLRAISDSLDRELRSILTAEQRARLDSLRSRATMMVKRKSSTGTTRVDTIVRPADGTTP
ncbi:MAG TPA: hypothetical protein VJ803_08030 [Gemmatimonadaceae bacterium]|nr:hypothetical protein [Gemmatimonadaceae bacterium]